MAFQMIPPRISSSPPPLDSVSAPVGFSDDDFGDFSSYSIYDPLGASQVHECKPRVQVDNEEILFSPVYGFTPCQDHLSNSDSGPTVVKPVNNNFIESDINTEKSISSLFSPPPLRHIANLSINTPYEELNPPEIIYTSDTLNGENCYLSQSKENIDKSNCIINTDVVDNQSIVVCYKDDSLNYQIQSSLKEEVVLKLSYTKNCLKDSDCINDEGNTDVNESFADEMPLGNLSENINAIDVEYSSFLFNESLNNNNKEEEDNDFGNFLVADEDKISTESPEINATDRVSAFNFSCTSPSISIDVGYLDQSCSGGSALGLKELDVENADEDFGDFAVGDESIWQADFDSKFPVSSSDSTLKKLETLVWKWLPMISDGTLPEVSKEDITSVWQTALNDAFVWRHIEDVDSCSALSVSWVDSCIYQNFLSSLNVDARNIVSKDAMKMLFGQKWSSCVPLFAQTLGFMPLTPAKSDSLSSDCSKVSLTYSENCDKNVSQEVPVLESKESSNIITKQESIPPAKFDWSSSGLTNPLEISGLERELMSSKEVPVSEKSTLMDQLLRKNVHISKVIPTSLDTLSPEARSAVENLPDLSFMKSRVLMFPLSKDTLPP